MARIGSREYWRDPNSYPTGWAARSSQAARFISPGSTVLDIGCGPHMALRQHLPPDCVYCPADLCQWTPEVRRADVDADIFPEGAFDCVVLLGVIEYLTHPCLAFRFAEHCASAMVISYCYPLSPDPIPRQRAGWINAFLPDELANLAVSAGWEIARSETYGKSIQMHQMIHALCRSG